MQSTKVFGYICKFKEHRLTPPTMVNLEEFILFFNGKTHRHHRG